MMNPRIRELADQCYHRYSEYNIDLEKFAELIVQECQQVVEQAVIQREPASTYVKKIEAALGGHGSASLVPDNLRMYDAHSDKP